MPLYVPSTYLIAALYAVFVALFTFCFILLLHPEYTSWQLLGGDNLKEFRLICKLVTGSFHGVQREGKANATA